MYWYRNALSKALNAEWDFDSDTIKATLHTSSYTINADTHDYVDDLTNEVSGTGYSTGGVTLGSKTRTYTAANSWGTSWATNTAYVADWYVRPTTGNGYVYHCTVAGTSHASTEPTWPTVIGATVTDNTVTWTCIGRGILALDAADPSWSSSTITARYLVVSSRTAGAASAQPLIGYTDFGSNQTSTNGTFTVVFSAQGALLIPIA